jgi:hypothetical protein
MSPEGDEYSTVTLGSLWGVLSIACFGAALVTRQLVRWLLPPVQQGFHLSPPLAVRIVPVLALIGIVLGLIGLRRERNNRSLSLLGLALNGVTLLLVGAFAIGFWWVRFR